MAENSDEFPVLIPLIWQLNANTSPNGSSRFQMFTPQGFIPHAQWGGSVHHVGASSALSIYTNMYNSFVNIPSSMEIVIGAEVSDSHVNVSANVNMLDSISTTNNKIIFILSYNFDATQPGNYFASVVRYNEQNFDLTDAGQSNVFSQQMLLDPTWDKDLVNIVVIVQTFSGDHVIHQAAMRKMDVEMGPPQSLTYEKRLELSPPEIRLYWDEPDFYNTDLLSFTIFRNGVARAETTGWSFIDRNFSLDTHYSYYVIANYVHGISEPSNVVEIDTTVSEFDPSIIPDVTFLGNNFPNPFNPTTNISFGLHEPASVLLKIFNLRGQVVKTLIKGTFDSGQYTARWDGLDDNGVEVGSGVYFYQIEIPGFVETKRMVLMK